jgi:hypothetical protein
MVGNDHPQPVLRPSPALACGPDAASFNARWANERRDASKAQRKAEYEQSRLSTSQTFRKQSRNR